MIDLNKLIEQANEMAPLPASTVRLAELVGRSDCHLGDVVELITFDQSLTLRLLRAANSAANANSQPVSSVLEAINRIGTAQVLALVVAGSTRPQLQVSVPAYGLDEGALWRHSVAAAVAAETIPNFCQVDIPPETFTAALLHDVGKLIMGRFLSQDVLDFIKRAHDVDNLSQLEAEALLLNVHHGELGGLVAQHWKLPPLVVQGITFHHNPEQGFHTICDLTYLANLVAKRIEAGLSGKRIDFNVDPGVVERLGLTRQALDSLCPVASQRFAQVSLRYNAA